MEANHDAPVCESGEILIDAPPETVWDTLTDLHSWPNWMPGVTKMEVDEPLRVGTKFTWKAGPGSIRSEALETDRPRRVGWTGRTLGVTALHVWQLEASGDGTRVVTEESWSGPLARVLRSTTRKTVRSALDRSLPALRDEAVRRATSSRTQNAGPGPDGSDGDGDLALGPCRRVRCPMAAGTSRERVGAVDGRRDLAGLDELAAARAGRSAFSDETSMRQRLADERRQQHGPERAVEAPEPASAGLAADDDQRAPSGEHPAKVGQPAAAADVEDDVVAVVAVGEVLARCSR